jgi:hypothetical protein
MVSTGVGLCWPVLSSVVGLCWPILVGLCRPIVGLGWSVLLCRTPAAGQCLPQKYSWKIAKLKLDAARLL